MFEIPDDRYPTLQYTVSLFTGMGFTHGLLMNYLTRRSLLAKPAWIVYRTIMGAGVGMAVHHVSPVLKYAKRKEKEFAEKMQAWEAGVLRRREMERLK